MNKLFWGPNTWLTIHYTAAGFLPANSLSYANFIDSLQYILPCASCKQHLINNLKIKPLTYHHLTNNELLLGWTCDLHNLVNRQLNKSILDYRQIRNFYLNNQNPDFWIPNFWKMFHSFASAYDTSMKEGFRKFVFSIPGIILGNYPMYFTQALRVLPLTDQHLSSNEKLFLWTFQIHQLVNRYSNGPKMSDYEKLRSFYFVNKDCKDCKT